MSYVPEEIIIVEGRDDTKRLIETFGPSIKTIETNGSAVEDAVLQQIAQLAQTHDIIIFTDPDYQGERIRRLVTEVVPQAKQAFLSREQAKGKKEKGSLGIEHATPEVIRQALLEVAVPKEEKEMEWIDMATLVSLKLIGHPQSSARRQLVAQAFHLGHVNGKQLQKRLALYGVTLAQLYALLEEEGE